MQRKILHIVLLLLPFLGAANAQNLHQYADNSALVSGKWVKIAVGESGIYKISYEDLVSWGIPDPANAHVFGYGGARLPEDFAKPTLDDLPQVSVWKETGADGVFNAGDYLLFYAQGTVSWAYDKVKKEFVQTQNPYALNGYYFVSSDAGSEKLIAQQAPITTTPDVETDYFRDYQVREKEERNLISSGSVWYGEEFSPSKTTSYSFSFAFPNIDADKKATVSIDAAGRASSTTFMQVLQDGNSLGNISFSLYNNHQYAQQGTGSFNLAPAASINMTLRYSSGTAWLNYIRVNAARKLIVNGKTLFFRNPDFENRTVKYQINGLSGHVVWDITHPTDIKQMPILHEATDYVIDNTDVLKEYVALQTWADYPHPTLAGTVANQNLHSIRQADYVIITHPDYWKQAETLARKHQEREGVSTLIVTPDEVYNEFSSGTPDATAFRRLMKMFYDRRTSAQDAPKYLLLLGDGTFDNRGIKGNETANYSKILTFQSENSLNEIYSYVSDDYFGLLDDTAGKNIPGDLLNIGVGRLPVSSPEQAADITEKICRYMDNADKGAWKNSLCYIADDNNNDENNLHISQADTLVKFMERNYPEFQPTRIFLDAYTQVITASGENYPLAREKIFNMLNSGMLLLNFTGHGSPDGLTNERIITRSDAKTLHNKQFPLFFTATCSFSRFDNITPSAGEEWLLKAGAGAIGLYSTTRTVYSSNNFELNKKFNNHVFKIENGNSLALGEIMRRTKNDLKNDVNRMNFTLLADPALHLPIPKNKVEITEITSNSALADTVQALSTATFKGKITAPDGGLLSQFNGMLHLTLFDKQKSIITFGNNGGKTYTYTDRPDVLLKATCPVVDGYFSLTTLIPKDIAYSYGKGRLNLYAYDQANDLEANGYNESLVVGGTNNNFAFEDKGPDINMYLNSPQFRSGDELTPDLLFCANLFDESGINASGAGIGHDLLLTLNNDPNRSYVLNEYYRTTDNDYRSGSVVYKLPALENGAYTLTFRAWDLLNNSSTRSLAFRVNSEAKPSLYDCYVMPNPVSAASDHVRFFIRHNQPQTTLKIKVDVYDVAGKHLWTNENSYYAEANETFIDWNWATDGNPQPGVYIYRVSVAPEQTGVYSVKTNKLIVK